MKRLVFIEAEGHWYCIQEEDIEEFHAWVRYRQRDDDLLETPSIDFTKYRLKKWITEYSFSNLKER